MQIYDEACAVVGVSELRASLNKILRLAKKARVYLGKHQKPVAVIIPIDQFRQMEDLLDRFEDIALGYSAQERDRKSRASDYLSLEEAEKRVGLRK